jgi:hypothetical protein
MFTDILIHPGLRKLHHGYFTIPVFVDHVEKLLKVSIMNSSGASRLRGVACFAGIFALSSKYLLNSPKVTLVL